MAMPEPEFLEVDDVVEVHADQVARYGGALGLRDRGLLESAVEAARARFGGQLLHGDLFEVAAAYLVGLVRNHAFLDGNKRVGAASAVVFLDMNGQELACEEMELAEVTLAVATGQATKAEVAGFLRRNSRPAGAT